MTDHQKDIVGHLDKPLITTNIRRLLLLLTQAHYADTFNHGKLAAELKDCVWDATAAKRTMQIGLQHDFDARGVLDALPCIYFGLGDVDFESEVIGEYAGHNEDNSAAEHVSLAKGAMQWTHCARHADVAENMAESTGAFFRSSSDWMRQRVGFRLFQISQIGMPQRVMVDGKEAYYRVDLRGQLQYNHAVTINYESHRLKKVELNTTAE